MSATWFIYSPLAPQQMRSLEEECDSAIEEYLEEHPDCDDQFGEILAGGALPAPEEVRRAYGHYRLPLAPAILDRLGRCRSVMTIDRPGDLDVDALQVSALRFLLERAGEALVMRNDYPLEPAEELLAEIARKQGAPGFLEDDADDDDEAPGGQPGGEQAGERRRGRAGAGGAAGADPPQRAREPGPDHRCGSGAAEDARSRPPLRRAPPRGRGHARRPGRRGAPRARERGHRGGGGARPGPPGAERLMAAGAGAIGPPPGLLYVPDFVSENEERDLLAAIEALEFEEVRMRGQAARRTVAHFGWQYAFESFGITPAAAIPALLMPLRERAATLAGVAAASLEQALVARYPPGAGIGWHQDAPAFGPVVVGVSLGAACAMRFRRTRDPDRGQAVFRLDLAPRSAYVLAGAARSSWQHTIPPVKALRYSITFRTVRRSARAAAPPE